MNLVTALNYSAAAAHPNDRPAQKRHIVRLMRSFGWGETARLRHRRHMAKGPKPKMRPYKMVTCPPQMTKKPWHKRARDFFGGGGLLPTRGGL